MEDQSILHIPEITPEFQRKMDFLKTFCRSDVSGTLHSVYHYNFQFDQSTGELLNVGGGCGTLPDKTDIAKMIKFLVALSKEPDERINLYNLVAETRVYESVIDDMLQRRPGDQQVEEE